MFQHLTTLRSRMRFIAPLLLIAAAVVVGMFCHTMNYLINHNENMYITAGVLLQEQRLYHDFAFLQMPYLPMLYSALFSLSGTSYYLLTGRLTTFVFGIVAVGIVGVIGYRLSRRWLITAIVTLLFATNDMIVLVLAESSNYIMPLTCSLIAIMLAMPRQPHQSGQDAPFPSPLRLFFSGVVLAIAVGTKLYYAVLFAPVVLVMCIFLRRRPLRERVVRGAGVVLLGGVVGLLPIFVFLLASPDHMLFNNVGYHEVNRLWRDATNAPYPQTLLEKLVHVGYTIKLFPSTVILLMVVVVIGAAARRVWRVWKGNDTPLSMEVWLIVGVLAVTTMTAFVPTPMFFQYFALPMPFLLLALASQELFPFGENGKDSKDDHPHHTPSSPPPVTLQQYLEDMLRPRMVRVLIIFLVPSLISGGTLLFRHCNDLFVPSRWQGMIVHRIAEEVEASLPPTSDTPLVATLAPAFVIEADVAIYPELATGPFLYRVGDMLSAEERARYVGTSQETIATLLDSRPPDGILVGIENEQYLDDPLRHYAQAHGYQQSAAYKGWGTLYVRPPHHDDISHKSE